MTTRTIVTLDMDDKAWLDRYSRRHRVSAAEVVRRALRSYRDQSRPSSLAAVVRDTRGAWAPRGEDAQERVDRLRDEWERR